MEIRSILVNFDIGSFSPALLAAAASLADRFGAELVGFAGAQPSAAYLGLDNGVGAAETFAQEKTAIETSLQIIEDQFRAGVPRTIKSLWRGMIMQPNRGLQGLARCADLVVVDASLSRAANPLLVDIGDLALKLGRPLLLAGASGVKGEQIVVGWKDSREARRAISDAMPFLKAARGVLVVVIEERNQEAEWNSGLNDVVHWLELHGVKARGEVQPNESSVAATIMSAAWETGADLIVAGAYGHSRLREWLFGGVTEELLGGSTISRLLSN
jgi:nucleotide-binding universal stress UspA family protein